MSKSQSNTSPVLFVILGIGLVALLGYWGWRHLGAEQAVTPDELLTVALSDASEEQREAATLELGRHPDKPVALVRRVFNDSTSPQVRAAAAVGLGEMRDWESMPQVIEAMRSDSELLRERAGQAVDRIVGHPFGFQAGATEAEREKVIAAIESEWPLLHEGYKAQQEYLNNPQEYSKKKQMKYGGGESP